MNTTSKEQEASALIKAINRWVRRTRPFEGGKQFGVDFRTWNVTYPQIASAYKAAATVIAGRPGYFMPKF